MMVLWKSVLHLFLGRQMLNGLKCKVLKATLMSYSFVADADWLRTCPQPVHTYYICEQLSTIHTAFLKKFNMLGIGVPLPFRIDVLHPTRNPHMQFDTLYMCISCSQNHFVFPLISSVAAPPPLSVCAPLYLHKTHCPASNQPNPYA